MKIARKLRYLLNHFLLQSRIFLLFDTFESLRTVDTGCEENGLDNSRQISQAEVSSFLLPDGHVCGIEQQKVLKCGFQQETYKMMEST